MNPISEGYAFSQNQDLINTAKFKVQNCSSDEKVHLDRHATPEFNHTIALTFLANCAWEIIACPWKSITKTFPLRRLKKFSLELHELARGHAHACSTNKRFF